MDNISRRDAGMAYISDESVMEEQKVCRRILQRLNTIDRSDFEGTAKILWRTIIVRFWTWQR